MLGLFKRKTRQTNKLDVPRLSWGRNDYLTDRHLLQHVLVVGATGSGKSRYSGHYLMRAILRSRDWGMLIQAAKPEDEEDVVALCKATGRSDDLVIVGPESGLVFSPLGFEASLGAGPRELTRCIRTLGQSIRGNRRQGGDSQHWEDLADQSIQNAIVAVKAHTGTVNPWDVQRFIAGGATSPAEFQQPAWQEGFHNQCLLAMERLRRALPSPNEYELALQEFVERRPVMSEKTRSSIDTGIFSVLQVLNSGLAQRMLGGKSNITPLDLFKGKVILVNVPPCQFGNEGRIVLGAWGYGAQRAILRRSGGEGTNVAIWSDEYQETCTDVHPQFMAQSRSHRGAVIAITQSIEALYERMGEHAEHKVMTLLGNFGHVVAHNLGDYTTAKLISDRLGRRLEILMSGSSQQAANVFDEMMGHGQVSGGFHEQYEPALPPEALMGGLRCGGNGVADAYVVRTGEAFSNGENWLRVTFTR